MNPGIVGPNELLVRLYYVTVGPQVSLLGTGVLVLLSQKWGQRALPVLVALSASLFVLTLMAPIDLSDALGGFQSSVVLGIRDATRLFPQSVRLLTIGLNTYGAVTLIGGALLSFLLDRRRIYALVVAAGGLLNAIGGTLLGVLGNPDIFLEFELLGACALFAGFLMSFRPTPLPATRIMQQDMVRPAVHMPISRKFALAAAFGAMIFTSNVFAPTPVKHSLVVIQALLLGLGALLLFPLGGTLVATIGGLLTAAWNSQLAIFTVVFAAVYGLLIDGMIWLLKARKSPTEINVRRFVLAITLSTALIGFLSYGTTIVLGLLPRNPIAEAFILVGGIVSGMVGGYLGVIVWRRAGRYMVG